MNLKLGGGVGRRGKALGQRRGLEKPWVGEEKN
jgi:hypothetical protein